MTGVSRRDFLKGLGSAICLQTVDFCPPPLVPTSVPEIWHGPNGLTSCFVGVGVHGNAVARQLVSLVDLPEYMPRDQLPILLFEQDCLRIPSFVDDKSISVLCGSLEDEAFWLARDLIQSLEPSFLITMVVNEQEGLALTPKPNEGVVRLRSFSELFSSDWLIVNISQVLTGDFWTGLDFAEIKTVMAATVSDILHYEAGTCNDTSRFKAFISQNRSLLDCCHRVYCHISIIHPEEVKIKEMETLIGMLREAVGADTEVLFESIQAIRPGSKFEMSLVCSFLPARSKAQRNDVKRKGQVSF